MCGCFFCSDSELKKLKKNKKKSKKVLTDIFFYVTIKVPKGTESPKKTKQPKGRKREIEMKTNFEGKEFTLTQEAYYNAGSGMYEAHAADASGKEYMAYFEIIDGHEDDEWEDTMCDWDNASNVQEI